MKILIVAVLVSILTGCAFLPYQYNENLSPEENAYYHQLHIENAHRAGASLRQYSNDMQRNERLRRQQSGGGARQCRWIGENWTCY